MYNRTQESSSNSSSIDIPQHGELIPFYTLYGYYLDICANIKGNNVRGRGTKCKTLSRIIISRK
jgi:hypothetical protein